MKDKEYTVLSPEGVYVKRIFRDDNIIFDEYNLIYSEMWKNADYDSNGCIYQRHGCKIEKGDIVLDIGANVGLFTNRAAHDGASKIISVEPSKLSFKCLLDNLPDNAEAYKFAISDKRGVETLTTPNINHLGCATVSNIDECYSTEKIYTTTIDDLYECGLIEKVDFLKIDTEGCEVKIFKGLSDSTIEKLGIRKIAFEFHDNLDQSLMEDLIHKRFVPMGFKFFVLFCTMNKIVNLWK